MYKYMQIVGGEEQWKPVPFTQVSQIITDRKPMFVTALAVNKLVEDLAPEQRDKLCYEGPLYIDWDAPDIAVAIEKVKAFMAKLEAMQFDLTQARWYITGSKGFHCEIPPTCFMEKSAKGGVANLPVIYKEMVMEMYVDTMDLRVYSQGRGRMWRQPNVLRENGKCKVQIKPEEIQGMTVESYNQLCSQTRPVFDPRYPELCVELAVIYARAQQKIEEKMKARGKRKRDPNAKERATCPSVQFMMSNIGIKPGVGFHELALQIAIIAREARMDEEATVAACAILIETHQSEGNRYNTPEKRKVEIIRMHRYIGDNDLYDFSIGAVKSLLSHPAPDLDGIAVDVADLKKEIAETSAEAAANIDNKTPDEFNDVAGGVTLSNFGVYVAAEDGGKRRVCAVSFKSIHLLMSMETGQLSAYEADVLVNGKGVGRQTIEMETFMSLQMFNRFCARLGHAFQGTETHLRGTFMRFIELAKKKGRMLYIAKREGLDILNIPNHENPKFREPFMVWADGRGVVLDPRVRDENIDISFQGFPDPRGVFKTDIGDAPKLTEWVKEDNNADALRETLMNMMTCQKADVMSKLIGWYTACFYRMMFHKSYGKFPLLHVNGAAGAGKTEMNQTMAHLFFYNQEPKMLTPQSTVFAIQQHASGSVSVPLLIDEYKPHEMNVETHNKLKLLFRDAYNCRDVTKGGGNRDSDDYRSLSHTQLAAPMAFIAEAAEEEAAVAERVVLVTIIKPSSSLSLKWLARYQAWRRNKQHLAILGQYLATEAITGSTLNGFRDEFDAMYEEARRKYMLTEHDLTAGLDEKTIMDKQGAKERSVYNFTVARFGLLRFKRLIDNIFGEEEFAEQFKELDEAIYTRMADLQPATQAEWAKVLDTFATMSYAVDDDSQYALRFGREYANGASGGRNIVEISMLSSYLKYRGYMRSTSSRALFSGAQSFLHAIKDSPAFIKNGHGELIDQPGVYTFDVDELAKLRVGAFKG